MAKEQLQFQIEGMHCQACATRIEKVLSRKPEIIAADVNFAGESAQIAFDKDKTTAIDVQHWIEKAGYGARLIEQDTPLKIKTTAFPWRLSLLLLSAAPFLVMMLSPWEMPMILQLIMASFVALFLALPFYQSAISSIRGQLANMDVLVSIATLLIYIYSLAVVLFGNAEKLPTYFETGVMVLTFVSIGKYLETRVKRESLNGISELMKMTPEMVKKQTEKGWQTVAVNDVALGDSLQAIAGERIATDGILESGNLVCDESHLTGEAKLLNKQVGDKLLAGSMVSDGSGVYQTQALGRETMLGDMMTALSEAQATKAPIARIADAVANIFVPVVIAVALLTFGISWWITGSPVSAMLHSVAVLVIACPCALGLATPAAIMAGIGQAVSHGVRFKDAAALEAASKINTVVFDKTGTLTEGKAKVIAVDEQISAKNWLLAAASLENTASHPLAKAIVAYAQTTKMLTVSNVKTEVGQGISGEIEGIGIIKIGNPSFIGSTPASNFINKYAAHTIVGVLINDKCQAWLAIGDAIKIESKDAIKALSNMGISTQIMSGDQQTSVNAMVESLEIAKAQGAMTPRDKLQAIQTIIAENNLVAMVGDGMNDSPAFAAATVSFAMGTGVNAAKNTASATLIHSDLNSLVKALKIAKATKTVIYQNFGLALIYNLVGIPLAAFGILSPQVSGAAMVLSSLSVMANALRLKAKKF